MKRIFLLVLIVMAPVSAISQTKTKGILLEDLTWVES